MTTTKKVTKKKSSKAISEAPPSGELSNLSAVLYGLAIGDQGSVLLRHPKALKRMARESIEEAKILKEALDEEREA